MQLLNDTLSFAHWWLKIAAENIHLSFNWQNLIYIRQLNASCGHCILGHVTVAQSHDTST
jgi:hypothetical protein